MNKSKTSLLVRIKEHYLPDDPVGPIENEGEIDFTGAKEDDQINSGTKKTNPVQDEGENDVDFT